MIIPSKSYTDDANCISQAAVYFATRGYLCEAMFNSRHLGMQMNVYFYEINDREPLEESLRRYANDKDEVVFNELTDGKNSKFYTLTLYKKQ